MVALLLASLALIVMATTMPWSWFYVGHPHWASVEWIPFTRRVRPLDFVLNLLLFVPFGWSALRVFAGAGEGDSSPRSTRRGVMLWIIAAGCLLSVSVELFQVYSHGRIATSADVLSNTIGTWLGARAAR